VASKKLLHLHLPVKVCLTIILPMEVSVGDVIIRMGKDPLEGLGGPMTKARSRKSNEAL